MTEIKKAKCCGTCKHFKGKYPVVPASLCSILDEDTQGYPIVDIFKTCEKHEWSEDEDQES